MASVLAGGNEAADFVEPVKDEGKVGEVGLVGFRSFSLEDDELFPVAGDVKMGIVSEPLEVALKQEFRLACLEGIALRGDRDRQEAVSGRIFGVDQLAATLCPMGKNSSAG